MKRHLLVLILLGLARACAAGENSLPADGILIRKPGNFAAWEVTYSYADSANPGPEKNRAPKSTPGVMGRPVKILTTKTAPNRCVVTMDEDGQKMVRWCVGKTQFVYPPGASGPVMAESGAPFDPFYAPLRADFEEFRWISKINFQGIKKHAGRDCLVFHQERPATETESNPGEIERELKFALDTISKSAMESTGSKRPKPPEPQRSPVSVQVAIVDLETRLPVLLHLPDRTLAYSFLPPPATMVPLPAEITKMVKALEEYQKRLARPPTSP